MEMTLNEVNISASKQYSGNHMFTIPTGETLKIETSPGGTEILTFENVSAEDCHITLNILIQACPDD